MTVTVNAKTDLVVPRSVRRRAGIKAGDRIVSFDGIDSPSWGRIEDDALLVADKQVPVTVERDGGRQQLTIVPTKVTEKGQSAGFVDMDPDTGNAGDAKSRTDSAIPARDYF